MSYPIIATLALGWLTLSVHALADSLQYRLSGVDGREEKNIELHLQTLPEIDAEEFLLYKNTIKETVQQSLEPFGFICFSCQFHNPGRSFRYC